MQDFRCDVTLDFWKNQIFKLIFHKFFKLFPFENWNFINSISSNSCVSIKIDDFSDKTPKSTPSRESSADLHFEFIWNSLLLPSEILKIPWKTGLLLHDYGKIWLRSTETQKKRPNRKCKWLASHKRKLKSIFVLPMLDGAGWAQTTSRLHMGIKSLNAYLIMFLSEFHVSFPVITGH